MHPNISDFLAMVAAPPIVRHPQDSLLGRLYQAWKIGLFLSNFKYLCKPGAAWTEHDPCIARGPVTDDADVGSMGITMGQP